jgi:predicted nucleic acid-binding Zn finger protein
MMIDSDNPRFRKAVEIADRAGSWLRIRDVAGHCKAVGILSSRGDRFYVVTRQHCDCEDWRRHQWQPCKHMQALELAIARRQTPQLPASVVVDSLSEMVRQRGARYDDIFSHVEGE